MRLNSYCFLLTVHQLLNTIIIERPKEKHIYSEVISDYQSNDKAFHQIILAPTHMRPLFLRY